VNVTHHQLRVLSGYPSRTGVLSIGTKAQIATVTGLVGGLGLAVPVIVYGWVSSVHSALELPMAATAWIFGLDNFTQNGYQWSPIVVGALILAAFALINGIAYSGFADRFLRSTTMPETVGVGLAWGFVSWLFFWYTMLPVAHAGAPFMASITPITLWGLAVPIAGPTVAPVWAFVLGFALLGMTTSVAHRLLRRQ